MHVHRTADSDARRSERLRALLLQSLPLLLGQQLPTGELLAFVVREGTRVPVTCPMLSVLALRALDCLDPASDHFHERLFDLLPPPARLGTRLAVDTMRWRLRLASAAAQSASGVWRRFGPYGDSAPDLASTAAALLCYLQHTRRPRQNCAAVLERTRTLGAELSPAGEVLELEVLQRVADISSTPSDELFDSLQPQELFAPFLVAEAHLHGSLQLSPAQLDKLRSLALTVPDFYSHTTMRRFDTAFLLTLRSACGLCTAAAVDALLADPTPPSRWPPEPLAGYACCPAATLAVVLRSLSEAILYPRELEPGKPHSTSLEPTAC